MRQVGDERGVGVGERVMYAEERPAFWAKNRYGLPVELPLSWDAFQKSIVVPEPTKPQPTTPKKKAANAAKE